MPDHPDHTYTASMPPVTPETPAGTGAPSYTAPILPLCPKAAFPGLSVPVSRILFGTAASPMTDGDSADELLDLAVSFGFNAFDTARGYGRAEENLGKWMSRRKNRDSLVILSKCGDIWPRGYVRVDREVIRDELSKSLEALRTDCIDIYLLHRDDPETPLGELLETLNDAKESGKIRVFGGSNWTVDRIREANAFAASHGLTGFTVSSPNYSLGHQLCDVWGGGCVTITGPEHAEDRAYYAETGMPVIAYSALSRGLLSGRFRHDEPEKAREIMDPTAQKGYLSKENLMRLKAAEEYAAAHGLTVPQTAVRYVLSSPMNLFASVTMRSAARMRENLAAALERMPECDRFALENCV